MKTDHHYLSRSRAYLFVAVLALALTAGCRKDDSGENGDIVSQETIATNTWIYGNMKTYYLWNDKLTEGLDYMREPDPEAYFHKLLYKTKDKWSAITDDYASLSSELNGDPVTMGYYPAFYLIGPNRVMIVVNYVYPGSAAAEAGLKRGDLILTINNTDLDTANYYELYSSKNYSVQLGKVVNNTLLDSGISYNLVARTTATDPAIYHEVLDLGGHKIGYLVYVEFITGEGNAFLHTLDSIFADFSAAGITDLIVDLRYNPGGDVEAAIHLASEIAPAQVAANGSVMVNLEYNADFQDFLESSQNYSDYLKYNFITTPANANMSRVYFLTTSGTASASELLITGLEPYMDVVQVGESTYGKYVGAWVIPDDNEKWAIMPIVSKFSNANGFTDFENGLTPDQAVDDDLSSALPFGDTGDPVFAKALELITGSTVGGKKATTTVHGFTKIVPHRMMDRKNLLLPALNRLK